MSEPSHNTGHSIHALELGPMQNVIHLLKDEATGRCAVLDPAWDVPAIEQKAKDINATITDVFLTHTHHDHINGLDELLSRHNVPVHLSNIEYDFWGETVANPKLYEDGGVIQLGETTLHILLTPGHTPGSICFHVGDDLLTGDTLFIFGSGRCDLDGGDPHQLFHSLQRLKTHIPPHTQLYCGHHLATQATSIMAEQIEGNPFLHFKDADAFSEYRMVTHGKTRSYPLESITENELHLILSNQQP